MTDEQLGEMLVKIAHINHKLSDENFLRGLNGDALSYTGVKLAAMKASILDLKVAAQQDMLDKEVLLGQAKAQAYAKAKAEHNATAASDLKYMDEGFMQAQRDYGNAKIQFEKLRSVVADTHDLIDSIKSRVIDMQGARKDERLG